MTPDLTTRLAQADKPTRELLEDELAQMLTDCPPFFRSPLRWLWNALAIACLKARGLA